MVVDGEMFFAEYLGLASDSEQNHRVNGGLVDSNIVSDHRYGWIASDYSWQPLFTHVTCITVASVLRAHRSVPGYIMISADLLLVVAGSENSY